MGLLDILTGAPASPAGTTSTGMSPIAKAILALLAAKAIGSLGNLGNTTAAPASPSPGATPPSPGNLGSLLPGDLGKLLQGGLTGANTGSILSGGLNDLLKRFQDTGTGDIAKTWVGPGPNKDITENDLAKSIGLDDLDALAQHAGVPRQELVSGLTQELPRVVDQLTPNGRVPSADEMSRLVRGSEGA
jgi:uncharacterized protein YidB (DUF937 family)